MTQNCERTTEAHSNVTIARAEGEEARRVSIVSVSALNDSLRAVEGVSESVETIESIAHLTHLLSLNASVEAARASGEVGKGFAIVAQEVRDLAARTAQSSEEVRSNLEQMKVCVSSAAQSVTESDAKLATIRDRMNDVEAIVARIDEASRGASRKMDQMAADVGEISDHSRHVAQAVTTTCDRAQSLVDDAEGTLKLIAHFSGDEGRIRTAA